VCGLLIVAPAAWANTYTPTRFGDPHPDGCMKGDCSLREAVIAANNHAGTDAIVLQGGRTYTLKISPTGSDGASSGDLNVTDALKIRSSASKQAIVDGGGVDGVFNVSTSRTVTFIRLLIRGAQGNEGGGISASGGSVRVLRCRITGNFANVGGGISVTGGSVQVVSSTVTQNVAMDAGGAIYAQAGSSLSIDRSSISGNTAGSGEEDNGGAIGTLIPTVIRNSTISGNKTLSGNGGGVAALNKLTMANDTVTLNSAGGQTSPDFGPQGNGGGIYVENTTAHINDVTIARNQADVDNTKQAQGGGVYSANSNLEIENSLLVLNTTDGFANDMSGSFTSLGHNMVSDGAPLGGPGDFSAKNPKIGKLAHNGGPTETIALLARSPAINKANPKTSKNLDQRGYKRDTKPDIGGYEFGANP
jgi:predicted outer membrane repeat protein